MCLAHVFEVLAFLHFCTVCPEHVAAWSCCLCILQLHPPKLPSFMHLYQRKYAMGPDLCWHKHIPSLLLCSYKVHKIHKKKIENPELVDPAQTPSVAGSMQKQSGKQSNFR